MSGRITRKCNAGREDFEKSDTHRTIRPLPPSLPPSLTGRQGFSGLCREGPGSKSPHPPSLPPSLPPLPAGRASAASAEKDQVAQATSSCAEVREEEVSMPLILCIWRRKREGGREGGRGV